MRVRNGGPVYNLSMTVIVLTDEERDALRAHRENAPHKLMRRMAEAILMLSRGASRRFVADFVGRSVGTVGRWVGKWRRSGLDSIRTGHAENRNSCLLTGEQEEEVLKALSRPPSEQGLDAEFWSVPDLAGWIHGRFSVRRASDAYYRCLLHMAGLSFHLPESVDRRRAPEEEIEARMARIRDEIGRITGKKQDGEKEDRGRRETGRKEENEKKANDEKGVREDVIVVSADEVGIEHEAVLRRARCAKNTKVKLRVDRERKSQKYIGFLHESDGSVDLMRLERGNTENIVKALIELTLKYPGKEIVVVWDNASYHNSKELNLKMEEVENLRRVQFIYLPPYSPDKNPIEHVWNEAKNSISNLQRADFEDTRDAFETFIRETKFKYRLMKSS